MITQDQAEEALMYLSETDEEFGILKGRARANEPRVKIIEAQVFLQQEKGSVEYRRMQARDSQEYRNAVDEWEDSIAEFSTLEAQRSTATMRWETWRSQNSARKQAGNL